MTERTFTYGRYSYKYSLLKQERKTLSLTVEPCMDIILKVPIGIDNSRIEKFLQKKWLWLDKQLTFFEKYRKKSYMKEYVSGESFYYLGRQYKLIVNSGDNDLVTLTKGRLTITSTKAVDDGKHNKAMLEKWYKNRRNAVFNERYNLMLSNFNYRFYPDLAIRVMSKRWGSYVKGERIILNPLLIHASKDAIDYVITHELCHMKYKYHDEKFYRLLESKFPNWQKTKERLEILI